jgi:hypothetical protein
MILLYLRPLGMPSWECHTGPVNRTMRRYVLGQPWGSRTRPPTHTLPVLSTHALTQSSSPQAKVAHFPMPSPEGWPSGTGLGPAVPANRPGGSARASARCSGREWWRRHPKYLRTSQV